MELIMLSHKSILIFFAVVAGIAATVLSFAGGPESGETIVVTTSMLEHAVNDVSGGVANIEIVTLIPPGSCPGTSISVRGLCRSSTGHLSSSATITRACLKNASGNGPVTTSTY